MKKLLLLLSLCSTKNGFADSTNSFAGSTERELKPEEVTITTIKPDGDVNGIPTERSVVSTTPSSLELYQQQPRSNYYPEKEDEGFLTQISSVSDPSYSLPIYFNPASETECAGTSRKLCIASYGFQGQGRDVGPHLGSFHGYDKMVVGCSWDQDPGSRSKEGNNLRSSSLLIYFADRKTLNAGGPVSRIVHDARADFDYVLEQGATFTRPDGTTFSVDPNRYDEVVVVAQCYSYWSWVELFKERAKQGKTHPVKAVFADSAMSGFSDTWPETCGIRSLGKKTCYSVLPALKYLQECNAAVPTFFVTGDKVQSCHYNNTEGNHEMLKYSGPESRLVTIAPVAQVRPMYNGTAEEKVLGTREAVGGMVYLWLAGISEKIKKD